MKLFVVHHRVLTQNTTHLRCTRHWGQWHTTVHAPFRILTCLDARLWHFSRARLAKLLAYLHASYLSNQITGSSKTRRLRKSNETSNIPKLDFSSTVTSGNAQLARMTVHSGDRIRTTIPNKKKTNKLWTWMVTCPCTQTHYQHQQVWRC